MSKLTFEQAMELVRKEREYQDKKWGTLEQRNQSIPGYLVVADLELQEAKLGWAKSDSGRNSALNELVQLAAVAVAAVQEHGKDEFYPEVKSPTSAPFIPTNLANDIIKQSETHEDIIVVLDTTSQHMKLFSELYNSGLFRSSNRYTLTRNSGSTIRLFIADQNIRGIKFDCAFVDRNSLEKIDHLTPYLYREGCPVLLF